MYPREHGRGHEVSNWKHNPEEGAKEEDKDGHHWEGHNEDGDWEHKDEDKGDGNKEDDKDGDWEGHNKEGHHWDGHHGGHDSKHHWHKHHGHWAKEYHDLNMYFVEASLPPNVYIVLSDKGLEVKALYETSGNTTVITKVGVRVADKDVIVSTNENITIDGVQSTFNETTIELDSGSIKEERGKLIIEYGAYHLFIKMPCPYMAQKYETYVPHIGLRVGVEKSAKVMPAGFVGARISVDPAQFVTFETIV
jgi:hypothetical protein